MTTIVRVAARGDGVTDDGRHIPFAAPGDTIAADGTVQPGPHHQHHLLRQGRDHGAGPDHRLVTDLGIIQQGAAHADQDAIANDGTVDDGAMTNDHVLADDCTRRSVVM